MSDGQFIYITLALLVGGIIALYHITVKPLFQLIRKWMKRSDSKVESDDNAMNEEDNQTWNLLTKTLGDIGCYQYEEINYRNIIFKYHGEEFAIDASKDNYIIWIHNVAWMRIDTNDTTDADFLKQAINKANEKSAVTNLYITYGRGRIEAHCQMATYFAYNIPNYREYLKSILDSFFSAHQRVRDEFESLCKNQEQKERIEIKGFRQE